MVRQAMALRCGRLVTQGAVAVGKRMRGDEALLSALSIDQKATAWAGGISSTAAYYSSPKGTKSDLQLGHSGSLRQLSSSAAASNIGDDGFDPFVIHRNAMDADRADRMVRDLVERRLAGGASVTVRKDFLQGVVDSYRILSERAAERARIGKRRPDVSFAQKADELLAFVEQACAKDPALSPDTKSFSIVVDAYAKIGDPEHAEAVLMRLEKLWKSGNKKVKPNTILYGAVLDAWAKSGRKEAPKRATAILQHMEQLNQKGHEDVRPDVFCYSAFINAWAKSREKGAAQRAEAILDHMLKLQEAGREECRPNTICFNSVIDAWARSKDAAAPERAEALLEKMEELHRQGNKDVCPDTVSYNVVINAWAKSREERSAQRADAILDHMLKLYDEGGREGCRPDTVSFNSVIDAWARSKDRNAPKRAEALLEKMEELYRQGNKDVCPNTVSYSAVINAWAKSREKGAAQRAEAILNHMLKLQEAGREECLPNTVSFTAVIDAWAKSRDKNAYTHAQKLFQQMQSIGKAVKPDVLMYTSLINTLAVSSTPDKATKAFDILLEIEKTAYKGNRDVAPTTITFGAVMKACARTSGNNQAKRKALRVALETFDKLRKSSHLSSANPMMYDSLFMTIANASKESEYAKLVSQVFKFCCEDGVLNDWILQNLRRNSPRDVFENLIGRRGSGERDVSVANFPPEWSRSTKSH